MDSILWFHLECPKAVSKFDDPIEFKRKFRDFFADTRTATEAVTTVPAEGRRIADEYNHVAYPEDVREHKELRLFQDTFQQFSPVRRPESEDDYETEDLTPQDEIDMSTSAYGKRPDYAIRKPISREEGAKATTDDNQ